MEGLSSEPEARGDFDKIAIEYIKEVPAFLCLSCTTFIKADSSYLLEFIVVNIYCLCLKRSKMLPM